jgi:hypothetical protein
MGEIIKMMTTGYDFDHHVDYTGEQLRSHWIYETFDIAGDAIVSFIGKANVGLSHMVDIQDVKNCAPIYSTEMLHFIIEHFGSTLQESILRQRLFICIIQNALNRILQQNMVERKGDDLYFKEGKLSVSIATVSPVSGLIHVGLNIDSTDAPVKAAGLLSEMNLNHVNDLALRLMKEYTIEYSEMKYASYKVKPVH